MNNYLSVNIPYRVPEVRPIDSKEDQVTPARHAHPYFHTDREEVSNPIQPKKPLVNPTLTPHPKFCTQTHMFPKLSPIKNLLDGAIRPCLDAAHALAVHEEPVQIVAFQVAPKLHALAV